MRQSARGWLIVLSAVSAAAMFYVGAYQVRAIEHMSCPLLKGGCEAVADAPFARPGGIPDGFIAAGMYAVLIALSLAAPVPGWIRYSLPTLAMVAGVANVMGIADMAKLGAWCFYCLLTTILSPVLVWLAFLL